MLWSSFYRDYTSNISGQCKFSSSPQRYFKNQWWTRPGFTEKHGSWIMESELCCWRSDKQWFLHQEVSHAHSASCRRRYRNVRRYETCQGFNLTIFQFFIKMYKRMTFMQNFSRFEKTLRINICVYGKTDLSLVLAHVPDVKGTGLSRVTRFPPEDLK